MWTYVYFAVPFHYLSSALDSTFRKELTSDARELRGELFCLPCHDKQGIPICGACRRPIEERVVSAMGKHWYVVWTRIIWKLWRFLKIVSVHVYPRWGKSQRSKQILKKYVKYPCFVKYVIAGGKLFTERCFNGNARLTLWTSDVSVKRNVKKASKHLGF